MITITVAENSYEWRDRVFILDGDRCASEEHDPLCSRGAQVAHHIVYKAHLTDGSRYVIENGIALSVLCHALAHRTHNRSLPRYRVEKAVASVNVIDWKNPVPPFNYERISL